MKVELFFQDKWNKETKTFENKWTFNTEAKYIYPMGTCQIIIVCDYENDYLTLHLAEIPERIDLEENDTLWLGDANFVKSFPQPYGTLNRKSETIWNKPMEAKA